MAPERFYSLDHFNYIDNFRYRSIMRGPKSFDAKYEEGFDIMMLEIDCNEQLFERPNKCSDLERFKYLKIDFG